jgi:hypothetical protein
LQSDNLKLIARFSLINSFGFLLPIAQITKKGHDRDMKYLMKNLLVIAIILSYAIPVTASVNLGMKNTHELVSNDMSIEDHCKNCESSDEDCCEDDCKLCTSCCTLIIKSSSEINELKSNPIDYNTDYTPLVIKSYPESLIKPPIV